MNKTLSIVFAAAIAFMPFASAYAASGAVWTNTGPCGDPQNVNQYSVGQDFYGHGANLKANKEYGWVVKGTGKNGTVLKSGKITTNATGGFCEKLFDVSQNDVGGPYQFQVGTWKNDNFKIVPATVPPPPSQCLVPNVLGDLEPFVFGASGEPTVQQIFSYNGFTTNVLTDQMNYQVWNLAYPGATTVSFKVDVIGMQSAYNQQFGWYKAGQPGTFVPLFTQSAWVTTTDATNSNIPVTIPAADAASIAFADNAGNVLWTTEKTFNPGGKDAVAAYNPADNTYLLAFEDVYVLDNDYNDLVVKVYDITCQ